VVSHAFEPAHMKGASARTRFMDQTVTMVSALTACLAVSLLVFFPDFYPFTSPFTAWRTANQPRPQQASKPVEKWNLHYHLGGNGPWVPKVEGIVDGGIDVPEGCKVEQVHMVGPAIRLEVGVVSDFLSSHSHRSQGMLNDTQPYQQACVRIQKSLLPQYISQS